jgi:hypothetical protein
LLSQVATQSEQQSTHVKSHHLIDIVKRFAKSRAFFSHDFPVSLALNQLDDELGAGVLVVLP